MEILTLYPDSIDSRAIARAADLLRRGKLVIYPTDTHPALAADALNPAAIADLCALKGVDPEKHTLTLVCSGIASAAQYARIDDRAFALIRRNSPAPITYLLPPATGLPKVLKKRKQLGIRIPDNAIARSLAEELGRPLLSGSLGENDPMELESRIDLLLVDASAEYAAEPQSSAIVDLTDSSAPEILRTGAVEVSI